jgi:hypothetical protein
VEKGLLVKDSAGHPRLAPVRQMRSVGLDGRQPSEPNLLVEYVLHNLSDADFTFTGPAMTQTGVLLKSLASRFGHDPNQASSFNIDFRNPVLAHFSAERLQILYASKGIEAVAAEIEKLKKAGLL